MANRDAGIYEWIKREEAAGNIFEGDDGYYVWDPHTPGGGFLNEYGLIVMAKYLQAKNAAWDWQIQHDPAISGTKECSNCGHRWREELAQ
jgi:hypothetical protein